MRSTTIIASMTHLKGYQEYADQTEMVVRVEGNSTDDQICFDFNPGIIRDDSMVIRFEPEALMNALTRALRRCPEPKEGR